MSAGEEPTILAEEEEQPPPSVVEPTGRDVILGEGSAGHKTNILLQDMMRLHRIAYRLQDKKAPETTEEASEIAQK